LKKCRSFTGNHINSTEVKTFGSLQGLIEEKAQEFLSKLPPFTIKPTCLWKSIKSVKIRGEEKVCQLMTKSDPKTRPKPPNVDFDFAISSFEAPQREHKTPKINPIKSSPLDDKYQSRTKKLFLEVAAAAVQTNNQGLHVRKKTATMAKDSDKYKPRTDSVDIRIPFQARQLTSSESKVSVNGPSLSRYHQMTKSTETKSPWIRETPGVNNHAEASMHQILDCSESDADPVETSSHLRRKIPPNHAEFNRLAHHVYVVTGPQVSDGVHFGPGSTSRSHGPVSSRSPNRDDTIHSARVRHNLERTVHLKNSLLEDGSHIGNIDSEICSSAAFPPTRDTTAETNGLVSQNFRDTAEEFSISQKLTQNTGFEKSQEPLQYKLSSISQTLTQNASFDKSQEPPEYKLSVSESTVDSLESKETANTTDSDSTIYTKDSETIDYKSFRRFERRYERAHGIKHSCVEDLKSSFGIESGGDCSVEKLVGDLASAISTSIEEWHTRRKHRRRQV